ncbi:NAD(P)-binding protein [Rhizodiscina lignyota]|uniref:NAD(P)-binding protein n=1 Tax=Rhizodiscina lignyota TaxID=1504668 RepID=A0A9P4I8C6_9PEZI|nr:NAD(P)-binding protein [Rhizodiscina lignyota]
MGLPTTTSQWVLAKKPTEHVVLSGPDATWTLKHDVPLPQLKDGEVLLQTLYLSNDPAQRTWIFDVDPERLYAPPVNIGDVMRTTRNLCKVLDSKAEKLPTGSLVNASLGWTQYGVIDAKGLLPLQEIPGLSIVHYLGAFGGVGLTALHGLTEIGHTTKDDAVVISGAAGGTGSMAVQVAKHLIGCKKVIGIAGGKEKCKWVESLGADVCVDYKSSAFVEDLKKATDGFVEVYFDNVGGSILDLMLTRLKKYGRVIACGTIANYNAAAGKNFGAEKDNRERIGNWFEIISSRLEIKGFILSDRMDLFPGYIKTLVQAVKDGKLKLGDENNTIVDTKFEEIPKTWTLLFEGANKGKLLTKLV